MHELGHVDVSALAFFLVGLALHALAQIDAIARAPNNALKTRLSVFSDRWVQIVVRGGICTALFVLWLQGQLVDTLEAMSIPVPQSFQGLLDLHVGGAIGLLAGYVSDSALAYVPWFNSSAPPPSGGDA